MGWVTIAMVAISAISAMAQSKQQEKQYKAQAQANEYNSAVLKQRADTAQSVYGQREERQRREARMVLGEQRAAIAQSGTGMLGSNADIQRQSEVAAELDALNIRYEGDLEARGLLAQSSLESWEAGINRSSAKSARTSGFLGVAGAALKGFGGYAGSLSGGASATPSLGLYGGFSSSYTG